MCKDPIRKKKHNQQNANLSHVTTAKANAPIRHQVMPNAAVNQEPVDYRQSEKSVDDIKISIPNVQPVYDMGNHRSESLKPTQPQYDMPTSNSVSNMTLEQIEEQSQNASFDGIKFVITRIKSTTCRISSRRTSSGLQRIF